MNAPDITSWVGFAWNLVLIALAGGIVYFVTIVTLVAAYETARNILKP